MKCLHKSWKWAVMNICVMGIDFASSYDFLLDIGTVPTVWYIWFSFNFFRTVCGLKYLNECYWGLLSIYNNINEIQWKIKEL
jgi:hypothetical protein